MKICTICEASKSLEEFSKFYIYIHNRATDGAPFYVGKGSGNRVYSKYRRNPYWHNVSNKHGYTVDIIKHFEDEDEAFKYERRLIAFLGKVKGFKLTNLTDGGGGMSGKKHSKEAKKKMSDSLKGDKNHMFGKKHSEDARRKMSKAQKYRFNNGAKSPLFGKFGEESCHFKGYWVTPYGKFASMSLAAKANEVVPSTIYKRCNSKTERFKDWYFEPVKEII